MTNIWKKYQKIWTVVAFLSLMAAAYYFGILRLVGAIESKNQRIREVSALREHRQAKLEDLPKYRDQQKVIDQDESSLRKLIDQSDKEAVKALIEDVEALAERAGCRYETIAIADKAEAVKRNPSRRISADAKAPVDIWLELKDAQYMRLDLKASGSFRDVFDFLRKLDNMPYMTDVMSFKIIPIDKDSDKISGQLFDQDDAKRIVKSTKGEAVELSANLVIYTDKKTE